ncbi:hypothetical protein [Microbacterium sp. RU33B]|uniref:hypothetical protein n=1 Tax=Microbacterium sp. RU33B TaxID=1907390 RepID=UPI00095B6A66|nr:hypothetical protein [Microbacterium sp. RU33B]SIT70230.1 hypothetical protein SAMN05880545_0658 [Microbacterium sp. RU33B]
MIPSALPAIEPLDWYPKKFTPGDMDATGGERLLGRTELSPLEVLVRETAQNSWDARLDGTRPTYGVSLRRADFRFREDLARLLPEKHRATPVGPLAYDCPYVLEVFDRGTCGLDGPVTLKPVQGDLPRNFQDLILKVGVPRDDGKGGGTYGFGKTASYAFSSRGTVLYWTRCRNEQGRLEHRFIVSAFRDSYQESSVQYTGRHWWGRREGDNILPVIGPEAEALGYRLFQRGFGAGETGTSMLIIEPTLTPESLGSTPADELPLTYKAEDVLGEFAARARSAIRRHLWPKLIPIPGAVESPMDISLEAGDATVPLVDEKPGSIELWGAGLNAIRSVRQRSTTSVTTPQGLPVNVLAVTRLQQTIGHLAIVRRVLAIESPPNHDDLDPRENATVTRIALMRGQAELVVATVDWVAQSPLEGMDWLAVYKSTDDWDAVYARTEPPAHDAWVSSSGGEPALVVKATKQRVSKAIRNEMYPEPVVVQPEDRPVRTGALSRRFGYLVPSPAVSPPSTPGPSGGGTGRQRGHAKNRHRLEISAPRLVETREDGRQRQSVIFSVAGESASIVTLSVSVIGDEGAHEALDAGELDLEWRDAVAVSAGRAVVKGGQRASVEFTGAPRRALRIDMSAEEHNGDH